MGVFNVRLSRRFLIRSFLIGCRSIWEESFKMVSSYPPNRWTRREVIRTGISTIATAWLADYGLQAANSKRTRLFVREVPITVHGRKSTVVAIQQEDGTPGYSPDQSSGFHVEIVNELNVPTAIHWHGLILPNLMDGVPWVTQEPIPPGGSMAFDFPLQQSGTYWMHSHYALQEQYLNAAPLIIWTPEQRARADRQFIVMLSDFTFKPAAQILQELKSSSGMPAMAEGMKMDMAAMTEVYAQKWEDGRFIRKTVRGNPAKIDVHYDALLANRRTIDQPDMLDVKPGETVLLRLIAASSATDFYINTGALDAELLTVDGQDVEPVRGNYFQLAIAQRMDLRVKIPDGDGAFPILAQGEGTKLVAGVVLATAGASFPTLPLEAEIPTRAFDNTQERRLRAMKPLPDRAPDRVLPAALGGTMAGYTWTINGKSYPNRDSLNIRAGERVEIEFTNSTAMGHPMHLHGHDFQVVEIDGERISGAMRDTVEVPPGANMKIAFDADHAGIWAFHCHIIYHLASGMFTVVKYADADTKFWKPEETPREIQNL